MKKPYLASELKDYQKELTMIAALSNLFASGSTPMIYYRATENIYCRAFGAKNTSRSDNTADAIVDRKTGVGIKTFIYKNGGSYEKVAEFDKQLSEYSSLRGKALADKIASLRNARITTTMRIYGLTEMIYHCVLRSKTSDIYVFEIPMHEIDVKTISNVSDDGKVLVFKDKYQEYKFYRSKSTLMMRFVCNHEILKFHVDILEDPMEALTKFLDEHSALSLARDEENVLVIPLYAQSKKKGCYLPEKSGLNAWNASQKNRKRDQDEIYIRYPKALQAAKPGFFPGRNQSWSMRLPDGKTLSMKLCQSGDKAIMSNPNVEIGHWLLRDVLHLKPGKIVSYEDLINAGITSIKIRKIAELEYACDFLEIEDE